MRLHRLTLSAIGPFPGRHEIDIDALSASGLFLIEGPTGSGKSTLLDAVIYGLYGTLGHPNLNDRLPSAHVAGDEPVIELVFSTSAGTFRIRRTPAYRRPKRRGTGTTSQNATAKLWRLSDPSDSEGVGLAASTQEVGVEIGQLVGLSREQFSQTVVLPQGRFATFLRARPEERAAVLQDVFGTEIYERMATRLAAMAKQTRQALDEARTEARGAIDAVVTVAEEMAATEEEAIEEEDETPPATEDASDVERAAIPQLTAALHEARETPLAADLQPVTAGLLAVAANRRARARAHRDRAEAAEREALEHLDAQRELSTRLERRRRLLTEQAELAARAEEIQSARDRLVAARRAEPVRTPRRLRDEAEAALSAASAALDAVREELGEGPDADLAEFTDTEALGAELQRLDERRGRLADLVDVETGLGERETALQRSRSELEAKLERLGALRTEAAERPGRRAALVEAVARLRREAEGIAKAQAEITALDRALDAANLRDRLTAALGRSQRELDDATAAASTAAAHEHDLRQRWLTGIAGEIAATELTQGLPCPVCGSSEHPEPAPRTPDHVGRQQVEEAEEARRAAETQLQTIERQRSAERAKHETVVAEVGALDPAEAAASLEAARAALASAEASAEKLTETETRLAELDEATTGLQAEIERLGLRTTEQRTEADATARRIEEDRRRCRQAAGERGTVMALVQRIEHRHRAATRLRRASEDHARATQGLGHTRTTLAEAVEAAGFPDAETAAQAELSTAETERLTEMVNTHDADSARVNHGLRAPDVVELTGREEADVAAAAATHQDARTALLAASARTLSAQEVHERLERATTTLHERCRAGRSAESSAGPVLRMAELASAGEGNLRSITLATFVLLRRFEDVVAVANDRLAVMSDGRYSLVRTDEREGRARKAGLGLAVRDHVTGTARDPHTLSGGETFYVSLSLALGLADIVASEAGGVALDTLFIDEGFGALDPSTLDGVMSELSRLRAGGRTVGLVSHVSELKERITERVHVRRLPGGGSTIVS